MKWRAIALWMVLIVLGFALAFPLGYALMVPVERGPSMIVTPVPDATYRVFVVDWGYHTAIVVPQPAGFALGPPGKEHAAYLEYAWGDRAFYMESDFQPQSVFATLVLPTSSVLYLEAHDDPPSFAGARAVYTRTVDARTLHTLLALLEDVMRHRSSGERELPFSSHEGYAGRFYPAFGRYLWTRDCNWWTVERLRAVGLAGSSSGVIFSGQVAGRLRGFKAA